MTTDALTYRIAFASITGMGVDTAKKLLEAVGGEQAFFEMSEQQLRSLTCGGKSKVYSDSYRWQQLEKARREREFIEKHHVQTHYFTQTTYPQRLLEATDAPCMLFTIGSCDLNARHIISIVGTRHATQYGIALCNDIVRDLAARLPQAVVVSGLAYGIDIAAHRACLKHHLPTIAVMARGLNRIYPAHHRNDAASIARQGGMLVTDYLSSDELRRWNFLARNRIIAALADCTVVVESASSGGALVTASLAQSYNRDVMALPGRVSDEFSRGCNNLIAAQKALSILSADDLIRAMNWEDDTLTKAPVQQEIFPSLSGEEQKIVDLLRDKGDCHINTLATALHLPIYRVMNALVELECRSLVLCLPGSRYALH
ncbi:MAG: DNA-processing protein DprA [Muribaculaceae bacterium]|nr:DNA-processing protein DprA [Muribaculaceae bacterium]